MDINEYREEAKKAADQIADYYESIPSRPVLSSVRPGYLRPLLPETAPWEGETLDAIQADIHTKIMPGITHWAHPGFMAFFACTASGPANVAEMWSNAFNGAHFNWICSPAVTELETIVLDWLAKALALPTCFLSSRGGGDGGGGVLHGSASEAILTVMVAARERYLARAAARSMREDSENGKIVDEEEQEEQMWRRRSRLVALGSASAHSSTEKAARVLGVRFATVPVDKASGFAMTGEALTTRLAELRARGLEPFYVTATLGSTDVCAVDDFSGIATALAADQAALATAAAKRGEHGGGEGKSQNQDQDPVIGDCETDIWVHVDAAYAGSALILEENQRLTPTFARFRSFNVNPHKWLLTTFDCSALWVRSGADLITALSIEPPYLRTASSDDQDGSNSNSNNNGNLITDYRNWQIPLGRRFRSLKLWFVMRRYGLAGLRDHVRRGVDCAVDMEARLASRPDIFTVFTPARFALVSFRVTAPVAAKALAAAADNEVKKELEELHEREVSRRTKALYDILNASGRIYLTSTVVNDRFIIRISTSTASVTKEHVKSAFDLIVAAAESLD